MLVDSTLHDNRLERLCHQITNVNNSPRDPAFAYCFVVKGDGVPATYLIIKCAESFTFTDRLKYERGKYLYSVEREPLLHLPAFIYSAKRILIKDEVGPYPSLNVVLFQVKCICILSRALGKTN